MFSFNGNDATAASPRSPPNLAPSAAPPISIVLALGLAIGVALGLTGCAEEIIRDDAQQNLGRGNYEQAITGLERGLNDHPDSVLLRSGLIQARADALSSILANAASMRAAGKPQEARAEISRAQAIDPQNPRVISLLEDLNTEQRQADALKEAQGWLTAKRPDRALRTIEQALKDNPHFAPLLELRRQVEAEQRHAQVQAAQGALSESRPISLDFRDANLRTVLDVVSRNSGINFILDKDIRADLRVTVLLRNARVEDALDLIIGTNQLAKKVLDSRTIVVYPNTADKQREYQEQIVRVFYLASADAKGAAAFLKSMLKIHDPFVDERSNMLSLRDSPENIELAERLISLYDADDPEVLLEVEVLEVSTTRLTELGVQFPDTFSLTPLAPTGASGLTLGNLRGFNRDQVGVTTAGLLINLKRQVGDATTLADPKIRARNKEKAKILIGNKIPIVSTTSAQGGFVSENVSYTDVGVKLEVEPTIYPDDDVAIKLALEVSALGAAQTTSSGNVVYQINTRNASTVLRLHDGETQLLGGLITRNKSSSANRVPGLGDVPVLGRLFSSQQDTSDGSELVLAITPRVLRNIRHPDASETEMWVGTEASPRLRPYGGLKVSSAGTDTVGAAPSPANLSAPPAAPSGQASAATGPAAESAPVLSWVGPSDAPVGQAFDIQVKLKDSKLLRGMPIDIEFNKDLLQLVDVQEGDYFRQGGAATSFSKTGDGSNGRISVGIIRNQGTGASGEGTVLSLHFKALAAGQAEIRLSRAQPIGLNVPADPISLPASLSVRIH